MHQTKLKGNDATTGREGERRKRTAIEAGDHRAPPSYALFSFFCFFFPFPFFLIVFPFFLM